jgi:hypothetical protein
MACIPETGEEEGMNVRRWRKGFYLAIAAAGILLFSGETVFVGFSHAADSIQVQCFVRDGDEYVPLSNVDVYDASKAALTCNAVYMDCKGQCIGCYLDEEDDEYCYDSAGRKFEK